MKRHKVIKRRTEWKILVTPIIIVAALLWFGYFMINASSAEERYKDMEYCSVVVRPGDTLWSIAKDNINKGRPKDIRKIIYDMRKLNSFNSEVIHVGQVIKVPIYR